MIDFKFLDMHTNKTDLCYLEPLIEHYLQTRKFHMTIVESKRNLDYFILYIVDKYPSLIMIINKLHDAMMTLVDLSYANQTWLLNKMNYIKLDFNLIEDIKDINYLYDMICIFCFYSIPQAIKIIHIIPKVNKNGKIKIVGKLYVEFLLGGLSITNLSIDSYIKNEIFNEFHKTLYCCGVCWKGHQIHLDPYYYNPPEIIDNNSNDKLIAVKHKLKDLGYQFIEINKE